MIKVLIIEDEIPAQKKIQKCLSSLAQPIEIVGVFGLVQTAISFLQTQPKLDVIISDIELQDGNAFEIFDQVAIKCPIIFTTAYNNFWTNAFDANGIAYLLKPYTFEKFKKAWDKYIMLSQSQDAQETLFQKIQGLIQNPSLKPQPKNRFTLQTNQGLKFLEVEDIMCFLAEEGVVFVIDSQGKKHLITLPTLKAVESLVDARAFFRINRSTLVHKKFVETVQRYHKNSVSLSLKSYHQHLVTSQNTTAAFMDWIEN